MPAYIILITANGKLSYPRIIRAGYRHPLLSVIIPPGNKTLQFVRKAAISSNAQHQQWSISPCSAQCKPGVSIRPSLTNMSSRKPKRLLVSKGGGSFPT